MDPPSKGTVRVRPEPLHKGELPGRIEDPPGGLRVQPHGSGPQRDPEPGGREEAQGREGRPTLGNPPVQDVQGEVKGRGQDQALGVPAESGFSRVLGLEGKAGGFQVLQKLGRCISGGKVAGGQVDGQGQAGQGFDQAPGFAVGDEPGLQKSQLLGELPEPLFHGKGPEGDDPAEPPPDALHPPGEHQGAAFELGHQGSGGPGGLRGVHVFHVDESPARPDRRPDLIHPGRDLQPVGQGGDQGFGGLGRQGVDGQDQIAPEPVFVDEGEVVGQVGLADPGHALDGGDGHRRGLGRQERFGQPVHLVAPAHEDRPGPVVHRRREIDGRGRRLRTEPDGIDMDGGAVARGHDADLPAADLCGPVVSGHETMLITVSAISLTTVTALGTTPARAWAASFIPLAVIWSIGLLGASAPAWSMSWSV